MTNKADGNKFPFEAKQIVRVFANRGETLVTTIELSAVARFKITGVDSDGVRWKVTWLSDTNEQLYRWEAEGWKLISRYVRAVAAETEVD